MVTRFSGFTVIAALTGYIAIWFGDFIVQLVMGSENMLLVLLLLISALVALITDLAIMYVVLRGPRGGESIQSWEIYVMALLACICACYLFGALVAPVTTWGRAPWLWHLAWSDSIFLLGLTPVMCALKEDLREHRQ
jgi:hypothetical protein